MSTVRSSAPPTIVAICRVVRGRPLNPRRGPKAGATSGSQLAGKRGRQAIGRGDRQRSARPPKVAGVVEGAAGITADRPRGGGERRGGLGFAPARDWRGREGGPLDPQLDGGGSGPVGPGSRILPTPSRSPGSWLATSICHPHCRREPRRTSRPSWSTVTRSSRSGRESITVSTQTFRSSFLGTGPRSAD